MDIATFQRKFMLTLAHINSTLKTADKRINKLNEYCLKRQPSDAEVERLQKATDTDTILHMEKFLEDNDAAQKVLKDSFDILRISSDGARSHVYAILDSLMTEETQVSVNLLMGNNVHGKNYDDHISFVGNLPIILNVLLKSMSQKWPKYSERDIKTFISERLRQATKRAKASQNCIQFC